MPDTAPPSPAAPSLATWRVMTWNVRGSAGPDLTRIAAVISSEFPDVVAVQEIRRGQAGALAELLGWQHCWARKHYPYSSMLWKLAEGMSIMARHPLTDIAINSLSPGISTWIHRHRIAIAASATRANGERVDSLRIYNVHLAAGRHPDERIAQAGRVASLIAAAPPSLTVVAGDLNASDGLTGKGQAGDAVEVVRQLHPRGLRDPGGGPTYPSIAPRSRLDYVLVPDASRITYRHEPDGGDDWRRLSDHLPVTIEFTASAELA